MTFKSLKTFGAFAILLISVSILQSVDAGTWPSARAATLIERWEANAIFFVEIVEAKIDSGGQRSQLKVISVIKSDGRKIGDQVEVFIKLGSNWPYSFPKIGKAIAFLKFDEKQKCYVGFNLREAGLNVDQKVGEFYVRQYGKLAEVLREPDPRRLLVKKLQWNTEFTALSATRQQASHGIAVLWDKAKKDKSLTLTKDEMNSPAGLLTNLQKQRICKLFANEVPEYKSCSLIEVMSEYPSPDIDEYLLSALERSLEFEFAVPINDVRVSELAVELLPTRMGFETPPAMLQRYDAFQEQRSDFTFLINVGDEDSDAEKLKAKKALVKTWRKLATDFLAMPAFTEKRLSSAK